MWIPPQKSQHLTLSRQPNRWHHRPRCPPPTPPRCQRQRRQHQGHPLASLACMTLFRPPALSAGVMQGTMLTARRCERVTNRPTAGARGRLRVRTTRLLPRSGLVSRRRRLCTSSEAACQWTHTAATTTATGLLVVYFPRPHRKTEPPLVPRRTRWFPRRATFSKYAIYLSFFLWPISCLINLSTLFFH